MKNLLIGDNGEPVFGFHKGPIESLNINQYVLPGKFKMQPLGRKLMEIFRHKRWLFTGIYCKDLIFGMAIVHAGYLSELFLYVFDRKDKSIKKYDFLVPFALNTKFTGSASDGEFKFRNSRADAKVILTAKEALVKCEIHKKAKIDITFTRFADSLNLVTMEGNQGFNYTMKECGMKVKGAMNIEGMVYVIDKPIPAGSMDFSFGVLQRRTVWDWASGCGTDTKGNNISFNFSRGINKNGHSENAFWINGRRFDAGITNFCYDEKDMMKEWKVENKNVNIVFKPEGQRAANINVLLIKSVYTQPFGRFSGYIKDGKKKYIIKEAYGVTEKHEAKW
ncbi:MAG: DUF2804 domain-containing protein [Candidatus Goldbacteria bacterium]|nr:DUF2804 domain-containing protein [Candidatus Goldiibacteriota bacterium]